METLLDRLDAELPPFKAYYFAREGKPSVWLGPKKIAKRSGISLRLVQRLGGKISWRGVKLEVVSAFIQACGFVLTSPHSHNIIKLENLNSYLRWVNGRKLHGKINGAQCPFKHLNAFQWKMFNARSKKWIEAQ